MSVIYAVNRPYLLAKFRPVVGPRILPFLPNIIAEVLTEFEDLEELKADNESQVAALKLFTGLYQRVPSFMGLYVSKIIPICVRLSSYDLSVVSIRDSLIEAVTQTQSAEVCNEALTECWPNVPRRRKACSRFPSTNSDARYFCESTGASHRNRIS